MLLAAAVAAILLLGVLVTGGLLTTTESLMTPESLVSFAILHRRFGEIGGSLALAALVWIAVKSPRLRKVSGALTVSVVVQGLLGALPLASSFAGVVHSVLAHVMTAGAVGLVVATSSSWTRPPQYIADYGWPSLRSLSVLLPVLVAIQIALGAGFRHRMLGLMPHVIGAILISMFILMVGSFALQQCKTHATLSLAARTLMVVTFVQVFLGLAVFTVRSLPQQNVPAILWAASAHVGVGALLLAASVVLGMHIRRNVTPKVSAAAKA